MKPLSPLFPLLLLPLLLSGCFGGGEPAPAPTPKEDKLPPITQAGANTFGCKVNGKVWVPKGNGFGGPIQSMNYYGNLFTLGARRNYQQSDGTEFSQSIGFLLEGPIESGTYRLTHKIWTPISDSTQVAGWGRLRDIETGCEFVTDSLQPGTLSLEILPGGIIAGTFEFTVFTPGCDTIRVTDGRFDFSY